MALDPSIILNLGKGVTPLLSPNEIQDQQMQREVNSLQLAKLRQGMTDDSEQRRIAQSTKPEELAGAYYKAGLVPQAQSALKFQTEQKKAQMEAQKAQIDAHLQQFEAAAQIMNGVTDQASWDRARQQTAQVFGPEKAAQLPAQYDPALIAENKAKAMTVKQQLEKMKLDMEYSTPNANAVLQAQTSRANNADTVAVQRDRLTFDQNQPKGQVVQTDSGTMLVDPRTGEAKPVTAGGVPVQKPGKEIPANVNKSIIDNQQSLNKIDRAIQAITDDPKALGLQYAIPGAETIGQYIDSSGVPTRAAVADIGSLVLHDRSGAAVTVSEFPRLKPFIPLASDSPQAAIDKLKQLRKAMADEADLLSQTYSKEQGYKESPVLKNQASQQAKPNLTRKTIGGKTYENDGKGWYVVN